jgi:pyruvate, orthophosphate dikinase
MNNAKKKHVYSLTEGAIQDEAFLSRKGANLCELHRAGFEVPPAFILSSSVSTQFHTSENESISNDIMEDIKNAVSELGKSARQQFGSAMGLPPLLLSVRSGSLINPNIDVSFEDSNFSNVSADIVDILGAPESWCIPGVKESCLGIGMNDEVAAHLATLATPFIAYNTYAHFLVRFGTIVLGTERSMYRKILVDIVQETGRTGMDLTEADLKLIVQRFKLLTEVPADPFVQLHMTLLELYRSWFSSNAVHFRSEALNISRNVGTAVIVQSIVLGGTGVCFTRNPVTGDRGEGLFGTFWAKNGEKLALGEGFRSKDAAACEALVETANRLEFHFRDMQQFEYVYCAELSKLYVLEVHAGRRTPKASMKIAVDLVEQKLLTEREALLRVDANKANYFLQRHMDTTEVDSANIIGA